MAGRRARRCLDTKHRRADLGRRWVGLRRSGSGDRRAGSSRGRHGRDPHASTVARKAQRRPTFVPPAPAPRSGSQPFFPDDQAQAWLTDNVLAEQGITPDGGDFAAIHRARNALFGVWANAAHLLAQGRPDEEVGGYLCRWGLLSEADAEGALRSLRGPGMQLYTLGYYHGWRLVGRWLDAPDRDDRIRRLLTEQLLPSDLR
ncbi:hypothetical protein ACTMTJ_08720 [Phytohabitans sp. LJ34]|uniref:hypothetical protein n=1 Tax=Phytohabitans sp. LJ34 TaxID=3452217 RepID=UPI003F8B4B21